MAAEFIIGAAKPELFPPETEPEVAFLGRSNVGKSSLLNKLVGAGPVAFTSATPGRTQSINFYKVDGGIRFVDLPGYGFAKVPREITNQWQWLIEQYLLGRGALRLSILLVDARRGWMDKDIELRKWLEHHGLPYLVVATKIDKLKNQKQKQESRKLLTEGYSGELIECSAVTGRGVRELWQAIKRIRIQPQS